MARVSSQTYDTIAERYRDSKWLLFRHFIERYTVMTLLAHLYQDWRSFCGFGRFSGSARPATC